MFQGAWDFSTVAKLANSHVWNKKRYRGTWPSRADDDDDGGGGGGGGGDGDGDGDNGTVDDNPAG